MIRTFQLKQNRVRVHAAAAGYANQLASAVGLTVSQKQRLVKEQTMVDRKPIPNNWAICLQWVLLTSISKLIVFSGVNILLTPDWHTFFSGLVFYVVWGSWLFAMGALIATVQWWLLRRYFSGALSWIVLSGVGMMIGSLVAFPLKLRDVYVGSGFQLDEIAYGVVFGFLVGGAQWFVMRIWVRGAGWWVLSSTMGWALGMTVGELVSLNWHSSDASLVYGVITEGIPVVVTGFALMLLIQNGLKTATPMEKSAG